MINIALPTGRMGDKIYKMFDKMSYGCEDFYADDRKLVKESTKNAVRYLLVKPSDVGIYVERGAADIGVVGKDVILETSPDIYELLDLGIGKCSLAVAGKNGYVENTNSVLRVATKYANVTRDYYQSINREIEIIRLNGSIELAPLLGISDVIVDIVETGSTLRENDMSVFTYIHSSSARLVANKSSYKFKGARIEEIVGRMGDIIAKENGR
ncbi:MAG: ATP phosphoribosyltransferase [Christensenellales bacterium]